MASSRRSTRRKQPLQKYQIDPFEGLDILDDGQDHGKQPISAPAPDYDSEEDDEFQIDANAVDEPAEDELSNADDMDVDEVDDSTATGDRVAQDDDATLVASDFEVAKGQSGKRRPYEGKVRRDTRIQDPRFQPRGLIEPITRGSKEMQKLFMFGPAPEDQAPAIQAHYKWGAEATLPTRKANSSGLGGFKHSYFVTDDQLKREAEDSWDWYELEGGKEAFQDLQEFSNLQESEAQAYMPPTSGEELGIVMGPYKKQRLFTVPVGSALDLNDPWKQPPPEHEPGTASPPLDARTARNGWMLNLGQRIQCIEWIPNMPGKRQFLAVSTMPSPGVDVDPSAYPPSSAPAFSPQLPSKSSIQIWEFAVGTEGTLDLAQAPKLRKVICTNWGDVRSLKWCPTPRKYDVSSDDLTLNLGMLCGLWGDGAVRVIDISIPVNPEAASEYTLIHNTAFSIRPPDTVCSCFAWLSATGLAVGCANGCLGIWNLPSSLKEQNNTASAEAGSGPAFAEPVVYAALATTYVLRVTTCYPSRPHLLLVTSMAGYLYLIDLRDLSSGTTFTPAVTIRSTRTRIGRSVLVWHDFSQMALSADDNFTLLAFPVRRFFRQVGCTRFKSPAMALAVSPVHPFVLAACVGGDVTGHNPLRRAYETKIPIWNQTWFSHEWRAVAPGEKLGERTEIQERSVSGEESKPRKGISRILEGFKCELIKLFNTDDAFSHRENGAMYSTIYELKTTVTTACWNPNIHVGGWAAAGMASGLLRVEDIAS